jgi:hypothetical protein
MSLIEKVNGQKQRGMIYFVDGIFGGLFLLVLVLSTFLSREPASLTELAIGVIVNLFVFGVCFYLSWKLYKDLKTSFEDDGIRYIERGSQGFLLWGDIRKITVHDLVGTIMKLEIHTSDKKKLSVAAMFYKDPTSLIELFESKVSNHVTWERSALK